MGCVTAYAKDKLATFAHAIHGRLKAGERLTIFSIIDDTSFTAKIMKINKKCDFILLESDNEVCSHELILAAPDQGSEYILLGFSAITQEKSPFSVARGVFSSTNYCTTPMDTCLVLQGQILETLVVVVSQKKAIFCMESTSDLKQSQYRMKRLSDNWAPDMQLEHISCLV